MLLPVVIATILVDVICCQDAVAMTTVDPVADEAKYYLGEIFEKYGVDGSLSFEGFEHLMVNLGLGKMAIDGHQLNDHFDDFGEFLALHPNHDHELNTRKNHHNHDEHSSDTQEHSEDHDDHSEDHDDLSEDHDEHSEDHDPERRKRALTNFLTITHDHDHNKCLSARDLLTFYHLDPLSTSIQPEYFLQICPAIIFQLDQKFCGRSLHSSNPTASDDPEASFWRVSPQAWGWAFLAVTIISLVGLASVAVIPIMHKVFYNHLLQFLVALAIGTLTGDALLHLLPHAISPGGHDDTEEEGHGHDLDPIYKGAVILVGIYSFFMVERIMAMLTERRRQQKEKNKLSRQTDIHLYDTAAIGDKLCHHDDQTGNNTCRDVITSLPSNTVKDDCDGAPHVDSDDCEGKAMLSRCHGDGHHHDDEAPRHHHGHSHDVPGDISSVAWMVIMGDGLHNFTDGLAIGAAFADNLSVGLSTTVAVFCHELPHELGDFAVLLRAGMSVKQALLYNIVSSVLCVIGMMAGLFLGNLESAHGWIYSLTAGIFIYISLVDMLPEITSVKTQNGGSACWNLLLQMLGITLGVGIMLLIALYEDRIIISIGN